MTDNNRLRSAFLAEQNHLLAALEIVPDLTGHGTTIGDDSEANWTRVLREFLPARYGIAKGQVIDSQGESVTRSTCLSTMLSTLRYSLRLRTGIYLYQRKLSTQYSK